MDALQTLYDEAMLEFSRGEYDGAITKLQSVLKQEPDHFEAQLALGMAYYRKGDYATAIAEGQKAERLKPHDQLVHTNLSLFYMKAGDKKTAEHHGLQARISSWREENKGEAKPVEDSELQIAKPKLEPIKFLPCHGRKNLAKMPDGSERNAQSTQMIEFCLCR
jgi:tetratricopeptide (TPR) repeat protein